jgi:putative glutamine amidotransferase
MHIVGISCGIAYPAANFELREYYLQALNRVGLGGIILPPPDLPRTALYESAAALAGRLDGLLLSGGGDFRPQLWGEYPHSALDISQLARREDWELELMAAFAQRHKPVLGICRGMQLLNVARGGSLWQDLGERPDTFEHWQAMPPEQSSHWVRCREVLAEWLGAEKIAVNSMHHQAIRRLGQGLRVLAVAEDGVIEAVGNFKPGEFILGLQWHPERLAAENQLGIWQALAKYMTKN